MRESQYTDEYLQTTSGGRRLTPSTFLSYTLRGRAKTYAGRYQDALLRSLKRRGAIAVPSLRGSVAYVIPEVSQ